MSSTKNIRLAIATSLAVGVAVGVVSSNLFTGPEHDAEASKQSAQKQPLYWVAPMDANYRRDKPGKSPMGMDLIPVYQEQGSDAGPGTVKIAAQVVNNLGVRTANVEFKSIDTSITTVGYVQYDEDNLVHIHPRVEGWIETLHVKAAGDPVKQGQPLYTLYSPQLVNAQEEFLIALKRKNTELVTAAKARLASLQLSADFIANLEKSKKVKQSITFYAPQSGVLDGLKVREGFYVKPGTTLMSIGQLEQIWVEAEVFERDTALIKEGLTVSMTLDYLPGRTWDGMVDYVYPALDAKTRTVRVRLKFDNQDLTLKPNMFAQVAIHANTEAPSISVPKESVIRTGKQDRIVLALGDGQFKSIAVKIGRVGDDYIEVLEGLEQDDVVVTSAQFLIDSESSKSSDFKRMSDEQASEPDSVFTQGTVNSVMIDHRMVNITHQAVQAWDWPEMTMDFSVANDVDLSALAQGQNLHFQMTKDQEGDVIITQIHIMDEHAQQMADTVSSAIVNGVINQLDLDTRTLNISREAIEKWGRAADTLDFVAAKDLDLSGLTPGMSVEFTFEVRDDFIIVAIAPVNASSDDQHANH